MGFVASYIHNLGSIAAGRPPRRPLLFSYYVTHRCSLACRYCGDGQGRPFKDDVVAELPTEQAVELIHLLRRSCDTLDFTGGEPMVREDLETLMQAARGAGFRTVLNTKGLGLRRRAELVELSNALVLSVDSLDAGRLGQMIGGSAEAAMEILETLHWIVANRRRRAAQVVLSVVATPENLADASDVLALAVRHGLGFQMSPQIVGTTVHPALRGNERFRSLVSEVVAAKDRGAGVLGVRSYLRGMGEMRPYTCHPLLMPTIRPDGTVNLPCLEQPRERVDLTRLGRYEQALTPARVAQADSGDCRGKCHIFCHMALSLLQRHPVAALGELRSWRSQSC